MRLKNITIERATVHDLSALIALFDKANAYSIERSGQAKWTNMEIAIADMSGHVKHGECYVIRSDNNIAATMAIAHSDKFWVDDGKALYLHKLMKDTDIDVPNVGLKFLEFAANRAIEEHKEFLRCDTKPIQARLVKYYIRLGFKNKGSFKYNSTGLEGLLLEAEVSEVLKHIH